MQQNIVEYIRQRSVENLFKMKTFDSCWSNWKNTINSYSNKTSARQIIDLADNLSNVFKSTSPGERSQSSVSGGGASWEALVCWYLNLCLVGRRTVVIKHSKKLIPSPIRDAITVNYNTFPSNTESDLIAITFPDQLEYSKDKHLIQITDSDRQLISPHVGKKYNYNKLIDALTLRDFNRLEIHIIQCKTNWNDNAQIPMLWDMVYSSRAFNTSNISIGRNGYSISNVSRFTYSFVTVPTISIDVKSKLNPNSTCVRRVFPLSGSNYWGEPTKSGVANSLKEMLQRNLASGHASSHLDTLNIGLNIIDSTYDYFKL